MKNSKIVFSFYAFMFLVVLYFSVQFSDLILGIRAIDKADMLLFSFLQLKSLVGFLIASSVIFYFIKGKKGFFLKEADEVVDELLKVVWPTKEETKVTTASVFVFVGISLTIFVIFDYLWSNLSELIY